jgi:hypothetical protein
MDVGAVRDAHHPDDDVLTSNRLDDSLLAPAGGPVALHVDTRALAEPEGSARMAERELDTTATATASADRAVYGPTDVAGTVPNPRSEATP